MHTSTLKHTYSGATLIHSKALYDSSDDLENVELTSSTRRHLAQETAEAAMVEPRRLDFADCTDCAEVWDALCDEGVPSVCNLVDFGDPFSTGAVASMVTMCETFGSACSSSGATETCEGQCTDEGWYPPRHKYQGCMLPVRGNRR